MDTTTDTTTDDVHVCPCCGIPVKNRRTFNDHLETQSNVEYCCEQCGKVFASKRRMYIHVQKYHAFKYHCQECDKICHSSSSLKNHYNNVHEKKTFECSTCLLQFKWKNNLSVHEKVHEKQYGYVKNKAEMYYLMIKELENRRNSDKTIFNSKK